MFSICWRHRIPMQTFNVLQWIIFVYIIANCKLTIANWYEEHIMIQLYYKLAHERTTVTDNADKTKLTIIFPK